MLRHFTLCGLLLALAGCTPEPETSPPDGEPALQLLPDLTEDGVRGSVVSVEEGVLALRLDVRGTTLGSVQGQIRFDPAVLRVSAVEAVTGAFTVANTDSMAAGLVRFAAFGASGLEPGELVRLRLAPGGSLARAETRVTLDAAGTAEALPIDAARLHPTRGVYRVAP